MNRAQLQVCRPVSKDHVKGFRWFSSLTRTVEGHDSCPPELEHCLQFYSLYAQTGDSRYLKLCEDFLKFSLASG